MKKSDLLFELITVYVVLQTINEKGGTGDVQGYFETEVVAKAFASGRGWYNMDNAVRPQPAIKINNQIFLLAHPTPIEFGETDAIIRRNAIAKLSAAERRVLGV